MLNKEEEKRLGAFLDATGSQLEKDTKYTAEYYVAAVKWLAEKLKESNDELKNLRDNHAKLDAMLATALHTIDDAGIMEEYMKFRNQ